GLLLPRHERLQRPLREPGRARQSRDTASAASFSAPPPLLKTMVNLLDFDVDGLVDWFAERGEKPFRARQVMRWMHREGCDEFERMTDVAKSLRAKLAEEACIRAPVPVRDSVSTDGTRKWLL